MPEEEEEENMLALINSWSIYRLFLGYSFISRLVQHISN